MERPNAETAKPEIQKPPVPEEDAPEKKTPVRVKNQEALQETALGEPEGVRERIIDAIRTVFDPEIPVNILELGLIYDVAIDSAGVVDVKMTLTAPNCPAAGTLPGEVETKLRGVQGVSGVKLELVWDPPFNPSMMSEAARLELGLV